MQAVLGSLHLFPERDKRVIIALIMCAAIALTTLPFMAHELFWGHDLLFHLTRIQSIADGLAQGQFPVYLHDGFAYGYGYASGVCYPDLFLYFPALLVLVGMRVKRAFFVFMLVENTFCALCAYACFKRMFASRTVGLALSVMWTLALYRLVDLLVRACVGEAWALTFLPLIAYGVWAICLSKSTEDSKYGWIALGVGMAGILQSHVLSVVLVLLVGVPVALAIAVVGVRNGTNGRGLRICIAVLKAIALCIGLSLVFIVPFLDYYLTEPLSVHEADLHTRQHAVEPLQLFTLFWPFAGGSYYTYEGITGEMPYAFGWSIAIAFPAAGLFLCASKARKDLGKRPAVCLAVLLVAGVLFAWMCTSLFPWQNSPDSLLGKFIAPFAIIQFPWRLVGPVSFLLLLALGIVFRFGKQLGKYLMALCLCLTFLEGGFAVSSFASQTPMLSSEDYAYLETKDSLLHMVGEYLPLDAVHAGYLQNDYEDYGNKTIHPDPFAAGPAASEGLSISNWEHATVQEAHITLANNTKQQAHAVLPLLGYSEWAIVPSTDASAEGVSLSSKDGFVQLDVDAGVEGTFSIVYVVPLVWHIAAVASVATAIVLLVYCLKGFVQGVQKKRR